MSEVTNNQSKSVEDFGGILLFILFLVILGIIRASNPSFPFDDSPPPAYAAIAQVPTATVMPTEVIIPTATDMPIEVIIPTATDMPTEVIMPTATAMPTDVPASTTDDVVAVASAYDPQQVALGQELFVTCASCHAADARGVPNLGKDLVGSDYMRSHSDDEIVQLIAMGRPIWDPDNTTGIDMPSKGGNPRLTNEDILAIVIYLRSLDTGE